MNSKYDVIIIGTGFSGICAAIKLKQAGISNYIMLERAPSMGGTWWQNNYPGAAVDVPSILYSFSFEPFDWTREYAKQDEILAYTNQVIDKHQLRDKAVTDADVTQVSYNETENLWTVDTAAKGSYQAKYVINAIGHLSQPSIPDIKGKDSFQGVSMHTARWDHDYDYAGKRVAVIGTGASSIQVAPAIASKVDQLYVLQRTPHWVMPRHDHALSEGVRKRRKNGLINKLERIVSYVKHESRVLAFQYYPKLFKFMAQNKAEQHLTQQVKDPGLVEKLTPNYTIGCKRILISNDFYPMFNRSNVALVAEGIEEINATGIKTQAGEQIDVDMIVYATGFHAFVSEESVPFDVIGRGGKTLKQVWDKTPHAYLGVAIPHMPNFFAMNGPNTGIGHTSAIYMIESQIKYVVDAIQATEQQGKDSIEIKPEVEQAYNAFLKEQMKQSVWLQGGCKSWYLTEDGINTSIFPTFTFRFRNKTSHFNPAEHTIL